MYKLSDDIHPVLFIFMRTDMDSLNAGKAMAQAAHAANQMAKEMRDIEEKGKKKGGCSLIAYFHKWEKEGNGFGTTVVFNGDDLKYAKMTFEEMEQNDKIKQWRHGTVLDETYPLRDGRRTHFLPIETCLWMFADNYDPELGEYLGRFSLHD